jgi:glycerol-3-phosphate O-acyltransferase
MSDGVAVPAWLPVLLAALAAWALYEHVLEPALRFLVTHPANQVIDELGERLRIGIRPFQRTKRQALVHRLLTDPRVQAGAEDYARANGTSVPAALRRVERYAREIVPRFNAYFYFRVGYLLGRWIARSLYRVRLGYLDAGGIAAIAPDATVVFVMNHRSNMDYILAAYLAADQAALSYAVGEWARIWPLSALVRAMGAYFVRRNSKDELYRRVLERYIAMATEAGVPQALFPEGGLTRDGRIREPRLGVIDYMMRGFRIDGEHDLVFVPLGINYDRVLEDRSLLRVLDPEARRVPRAVALWNTLAFAARNLRLMWRSEWHRFGYACVNFGSPVSMRAYCKARGADFHRLSGEERKRETAALGEHLMRAVGRIVPVVPVPLMATVFARDPGRVFAVIELKTEVERMVDRLERSAARVYVPRRDLDYALDVGLRMLLMRHLVDEKDGGYVAREAELPLLRYYANSIAHLVGEAEVFPAAGGA